MNSEGGTTSVPAWKQADVSREGARNYFISNFMRKEQTSLPVLVLMGKSRNPLESLGIRN